MVGLTLLSRSYYYLRRRSPGPPFPPDHRQAGERGAIIHIYDLGGKVARNTYIFNQFFLYRFTEIYDRLAFKSNCCMLCVPIVPLYTSPFHDLDHRVKRRLYT